MSNASLLWLLWGATQLLALWFFFGLWPWLLNRWHAPGGSKPARGLTTACAVLGWVQVAQYALVTLGGAQLPGLFGPVVPASALLFPLSLATLLGLYAVLPTVARSGLFYRIARVLLLINGAIVAGTFAARNFELEAVLPEWAELWSAAATKKVGFGALIFVLDLVVMVSLFRFAGHRGWGRFRQIALPLLLALTLDAVLFGLVLAAFDPLASFGATVGDQLACKLPVGLVYAACVVGYLSAYVPGAFGAAGAGIATSGSQSDSLGRVFVRVVRAAVLSVPVALRLTEWPDSDTSGRSTPAQRRVMDDTVRPEAARVRAAAEAAFQAECAALSANPDVAERWVAYHGDTRLDAVDTSRERVFRKCVHELGVPRSELGLFFVPPPARGDAPPLPSEAAVEAIRAVGRAVGAAVPCGPDEAASVAAFEAEREALTADPIRSGKWVAYSAGKLVPEAVDASRERLFRKCVGELGLTRDAITLFFVPERASA